MNEDNTIISGFDGAADGGASFAVDFAIARRLERGGSTCDAYECMVQRRRVFVKRLKAEYRDNPVYRAAFDKEYDLGVSLSHPSLPRYVGFGGNYLVMDFIEGDTLSDLIKRDDPRLKSRKFVRRLLLELVDVVEYLHRRNIVHCDIKADNVIISPYDDRPATLIDLDKAYTSWLGTTHGNTQKYGCGGCADGVIDFRGIGLIAGQLGMKRVAKVCANDDVAQETIREVLTGSGVAKRIWVVILIGLCCVLPLIWYFTTGSSSDDMVVPVVPDYAATDSMTADTAISVQPDKDTKVVDETGAAESANKAIATVERLREKALPDIDSIVMQYYGPLLKRHVYLRELAADSMTTSRQLLMMIKKYADAQMEAQDAIMGDVMVRYGLDNVLEAHTILGTSDAWRRFMTADSEINSLYSREIPRRD